MAQYRRKASSVKESVNRQRQRLEMKPLMEPCPECGKLRYFNRKAARAAAKRTGPSESLSVYRCGGYFHIGHTPYGIARGFQERSR